MPNPGIGFQLMTMITQTAGTIFVMWLGEQITERGIGNGISLIIFIDIVGALPDRHLQHRCAAISVGTLHPIIAALMAGADAVS